MKGKMQLLTAYLILLILLLSPRAGALDNWQAPFDTTGINSESTDSVLSLDNILGLVAVHNPLFQSFHYRLQSANGILEQAGYRSNPELGIELEEVGGDASGFRQSEFTISLAQEFEFFGQRSARKKFAEVQLEDTELQVKQSSFDLYLETKNRFYAFAHAQQRVNLSLSSVTLAQEIVENINNRLNKGAALQSELLLAKLEEQRALFELEQAKQEVKAWEAGLASLWRGKPSGITVTIEAEPHLTLLLEKISNLTYRLDYTRGISRMHSEAKLLRAANALAKAEARPIITLSGGVKRIEIDNSNSFLFGVTLPIPFFNRNQGTRKSIDAQLRSLEHKIDQAQNEVRSDIESHTIRLILLKDRHATLDTMLLPTAKEVYQTLKSAYDAGRVTYTQLLEAERTLNDLSFEHNDLLLAIHEQIVALESLTGVVLRTKKEN